MKNSPLLFRRYLWLLAAALLLGGLILLARYQTPYPYPLGPAFDPIIKKEYAKQISARKPKVVVIGDSVVVFGVDQQTLTRELGEPAYALGVPGSTSAAWYLMLKNIIADSNPIPPYVVLPFRDTILTLPTYRTTGYYFEIVDNFAGKHEPLVTQLSYLNAMNPLEKFAERYVPLYSVRWRLREGLDARLRYGLAGRLGLRQERVNDALNYIFGKQQGLDFTALNSAADDSKQILYNDEAYDFERQLQKSYLPRMIQIAQQEGFTLVFVRTKTQAFPEASSEPPGLRRYSAALAEYLNAQENVVFIDLGHDSRLERKYYLTELHFNEQGKQLFTKILAEELKKRMR